MSLEPGVILGLGVALIGVTLAFLIMISGHHRRKIDRTVSFAARLLGGPPPKPGWDQPIEEAVGFRRGLRVSFALASRFEQVTEPTEITCDLAGGPLPGLTLRLRPARPGQVRRARKAGVCYIDVGDARFDDAYSVEGAPAQAVRALLDAATRAAILESGAHELELTDGALRVAVPTWVHDQPRIYQLVELAVSLAERARPALQAAEQPLAPALVGAPYRPSIDHSPEREARTARDHERHALQAQLARRAAAAARMRGLHAAGLALAVIAASVAADWWSHP